LFDVVLFVDLLLFICRPLLATENEKKLEELLKRLQCETMSRKSAASSSVSASSQHLYTCTREASEKNITGRDLLVVRKKYPGGHPAVAAGGILSVPVETKASKPQVLETATLGSDPVVTKSPAQGPSSVNHGTEDPMHGVEEPLSVPDGVTFEDEAPSVSAGDPGKPISCSGCSVAAISYYFVTKTSGGDDERQLAMLLGPKYPKFNLGQKHDAKQFLNGLMIVHKAPVSKKKRPNGVPLLITEFSHRDANSKIAVKVLNDGTKPREHSCPEVLECSVSGKVTVQAFGGETFQISVDRNGQLEKWEVKTVPVFRSDSLFVKRKKAPNCCTQNLLAAKFRSTCPFFDETMDDWNNVQCYRLAAECAAEDTAKGHAAEECGNNMTQHSIKFCAHIKSQSPPDTDTEGYLIRSEEEACQIGISEESSFFEVRFKLLSTYPSRETLTSKPLIN
jgi:hypothetical protein